ncbi:MAG TPA: hypothetical protein VIQ02_07405 [Jiangellaceae bacterium]
MLMPPTGRPDPKRRVRDNPLTHVVERLAARMVSESGGTNLRALTDIRAAAEHQIRIVILLDRVFGRSWRDIGQDLGVSAQAVHRKYGGQ